MIVSAACEVINFSRMLPSEHSKDTNESSKISSDRIKVGKLDEYYTNNKF